MVQRLDQSSHNARCFLDQRCYRRTRMVYGCSSCNATNGFWYDYRNLRAYFLGPLKCITVSSSTISRISITSQNEFPSSYRDFKDHHLYTETIRSIVCRVQSAINQNAQLDMTISTSNRIETLYLDYMARRPSEPPGKFTTMLQHSILRSDRG